MLSSSLRPLISVIVPVYNTDIYLHQCVDSILNQTYKNLEIILVDDESPDTSPALCDEYAAQDSRVRVIHKANGGLSDARNAALETMNGEYVGFVDSDDWISPHMFERLYGGLCGSGAGVACCEVTKVFTYRMEYKVKHNDIIYDSQIALNELFFDRQENYAWNKLYRADLWNKVRFPKGLNFEDIVTVYKTFEGAGKVAFLGDSLYYYRIRPDSISGTKDFAFKRDIYKAIVTRYDDVAPRMPQYRAPLFRRVRNWYIHELCREFEWHPKNNPANQVLLNILAPFVSHVKADISDILHLEKLEREKLDAFAEGTPESCLRALRYHDLMWKRRNRKTKIKKMFKL